ncbi:hypothetical protein [Streptomyces roseicoloratus]|uniref:hypothetical protein n=1 Tax=Streptomyces roseicoloratus TaxID=2508722 RepID=UPI001FEB6F88|nr:hypothetical protein [Streptomyces roseicoloratus]
MTAAAAAGVVLLVAGCGSNGGSDKGGSSAGAGGSSAGSTAGGGAGTGGDEALTADDVKQEIETAATGAGFVQAATGDQVPPGLEKCMVSWSAEAKKAADPKKSYTDTVAALGKESWKTDKTFSQSGSTITSLSKGGWQLKASDHSAGVLKLVMFIATDTSPACEALFKADLEKSKQ